MNMAKKLDDILSPNQRLQLTVDQMSKALVCRCCLCGFDGKTKEDSTFSIIFCIVFLTKDNRKLFGTGKRPIQ